MLVDDPTVLPMRSARDLYFEANGFGPSGGYDDAWVDFKLGPIPFPFPNTPQRVEAVKFHDLHHVLTGYDTDLVGEFEISAWEIAAGCKGYTAAWILNLGGMGGGIVRAPGRVFAAFVRGRRSSTTYGEEFEPMLEASVAEMRARFLPPAAAPVRATAADVLLFALATAAGLTLGLFLLSILIPLVPLGLVMTWLRRRDERSRASATVSTTPSI